jgi:hypothetical protein
MPSLYKSSIPEGIAVGAVALLLVPARLLFIPVMIVA